MAVIYKQLFKIKIKCKGRFILRSSNLEHHDVVHYECI